MSDPSIRTFTANYPGTCGECGGKFNAGETIRHSRVFTGEKLYDRYAHLRCPDPLEAPRREAPTCPRCQLRHPGECF